MANSKAFTLIELLVVVAIIGILAAVGVVACNGCTASAKRNAVKANHSMASKFIQSEIYKAETSGKVSQWDSINKQCKEVAANSAWHTHGQWAFNCLTEDTSRTNPFNNSEVAFRSDWSIPTVVGRTNCNWSDTKKIFVCYSRWGSGSNEYETTEISEP